jgi:hypothetical protein
VDGGRTATPPRPKGYHWQSGRVWEYEHWQRIFHEDFSERLGFLNGHEFFASISEKDSLPSSQEFAELSANQQKKALRRINKVARKHRISFRTTETPPAASVG